MRAVRWRSLFAACIVGSAVFSSVAGATTRVMERVGSGEVTSLVTDGVRYAAWVRYEPSATQTSGSTVTILDVKTSKTRKVTLPATCIPQNASAGLMVAWCQTGPQYALELSTGKLREVGGSVAKYANGRVGAAWIMGSVGACAKQVDCLYFENRATGAVVRKTEQSGVSWNLDAPTLRRLQHCGRNVKESYDPERSNMDGDLSRVFSVPTSSTIGLRVRRCGKASIQLDRARVQNVQVKRAAVVWATGCLDTGQADIPGCHVQVKAHRMDSCCTTAWRLPGTTARTSILVDQLPGWVFALRVTRRDDSSVADPTAYALYKARIPRWTGRH